MTQTKARRRKLFLLILLIIFGFAAFAGGSKLTHREPQNNATAADVQANATAQATAEAGKATPSTASGSATTSPSASPSESASPESQRLAQVHAPDATPAPTSSPKATPTPQPTPSGTTNPTASPSPVMNNSGISGRMLVSGNCSQMPQGQNMNGTCLPSAYQGVAGLYKSSTNQFIKNVTSSSDGSFWLVLEPGTYYFMASGSPSLEKTTVTVSVNMFATVTLNFKH